MVVAEQVTKEKTTFKEEIEKNWRLLLHDDDIHTIEEVCDKVAGICPLCPGPRAYEVTMQVHLTGAGTICSANKKIVQEVSYNCYYCFVSLFTHCNAFPKKYEKKLQKAGLSVSSAPEDEFEDEDEYGEEGEEVGEDEEE